MKQLLLLVLLIIGAMAAGESVVIQSWESYPTPECKTKNKKGEWHYLIPHGTKAKVIKWPSKVMKGQQKDIFAKIDMFEPVEVKILTGPLMGKTCSVLYIYVNLVQ